MNKVSFTSNTDAILREMQRAESHAIRRAANVIKKRIYEKLDRPGKSLAGQPPGKKTGNLQMGLTIEMAPKSYKGFVGFTAPAHHAHLLEFGAKGGRLAPRPFFAPSFEESAEEVAEIIAGMYGG